MLAAASFIVAVPTLVVYLALSKQFVSGLTLGSTKGYAAGAAPIQPRAFRPGESDR